LGERSKAESVGRKIPADILEMLAKRFLSNVRELEGALNRVLAFSDLSGLPLTQALVNTALVDIMPVYEEADPTQIIQRVSEVFRVSKERLLGRDRSASVVLPRQLAMSLLRENTKLPLPQIGAELRGRDHTAVMYACEKMNNRLIKDEALQRQVARIRELAPI
jgi:chromosomal replication initiator protein